jgi:hypothetical protein
MCELDPYSKKSFIISNKVLLTNVSEDENKPTVCIFKTEVDLVDVWIRNADDGYWTGGEFGYMFDDTNRFVSNE